MEHAPRPRAPWVVAVDMGYGHLRPASALAAAFGTTVRRADRRPLADDRDIRTLDRMRGVHRFLSRASDAPVVGPLMRRLFDATTWIPRAGAPDTLAAPNSAARYLAGQLANGFGRTFAAALGRDAGPLVTTYFAQAVVADAAGHDDVWCLTTDSDVNRVWVAAEPKRSRIRYLVPLRRTARRMRAYGVAKERIHVTGFPLAPTLLGGPDLATLDAKLAARLRRLDPAGAFLRDASPDARRVLAHDQAVSPPGPARVTFAVGGAGAQTGLAGEILRALRGPLARNELRMTLVAGVHAATARTLRGHVERYAADLARAGAVEVLYEPDFDEYLRRFDACLADTDVLWTKPSELIFYGALGLPIALAPPIGAHERRNGALALRRGFGLPTPRASEAATWLADGLASGALARAAWAGYARLSKHGTYRIVEAVTSR